MRRLIVLGISVWVLLMLVGAVVSADNWVRGKVTAVGTDTVTVMFKGKEMKFAVAGDTEIVGRGLGTAQRKAGGVKLAEAIKVGEGVEVHYAASGGTMRASEIRTGLSGAEATSSSDDSGDSASGQIAAVTASSLTIKATSGEMTFSVDAKTRVLGRGAGTEAEKKRAAGSGPTITDLVKVGEDVVVTYRTSGSTRLATEVRVRSLRAK